MAITTANGVRLEYEIRGHGETPLVLVHGSWSSHHTWDLLLPHLAAHFRVLTYDRRGHGDSERVSGQGSVREDVMDLAGLMENVGFTTAWIVGNSFGASIALRFAAERPDLARGLIVHEPPLFSLLADDPSSARMLEDLDIAGVLECIARGDHAGGAEQFTEMVVGPGAWSQFPPAVKQMMIENAPTFLDEEQDPETHAFDPRWIREFSKPVLLTVGDHSSPVFAPLADRLAKALSRGEVLALEGAGHIPHVSHPAMWGRSIVDFTSRDSLRPPTLDVISPS
ncbi:MAG: alpha/beta hydrolase [Gemmatimonadota bacterium]